MAKKKATHKKISNKLSFVERFNIPSNDVEHLEVLIAASNRAITGHGSSRTSIDDLYKQQVDKLKKELEGLRNK